MEKFFCDRKYFKLLFVVYMFINTLALGYFNISSNILAYSIIIYGLMILFYSIYKKEIFYNRNHLVLIGLYGLLLFIATYLNKTYSNKQSFIIAILQLLVFLLLFGQQQSMSLKKLKQELLSIIPLVCTLVFISSLISLMMYFLNIYGENNGWYIGLVGDRLFGIYFNCNPASFLANIVIILSLIAIKNNYPGKLLYVVNIPVQLSYIILTKCRASIIILAIMITVILYYHFFRAKEMSKTKRIVVNLVLCSTILLGTHVVNEVAFMIPQSLGAQESDNRFQLDKVKEIVSLTMSRELNNIPKIINLVDEVSSGRITLTKQSLQVWQDSPIVGIGAGNFRIMLVAHGNDNIAKQILHSHNIFLETLVTTGVFGFIVFFIFLLKSLFIIRDTLVKYKNKGSYYMVLMFVMVFVIEFIGSMFDFGIFYNYSLSSSLSWIFLGYIYWLSKEEDYALIDNISKAIFNKYELVSIDYQQEDLDTLKPTYTILNNEKIDDDYIITVLYRLGKSEFTYRVYYSMKQDNLRLNEILMKDFYYIIKDDIEHIYHLSSLK